MHVAHEVDETVAASIDAVDEHVLEAMRQRMQQYPEKAQQRKEIVEHPFGTMKHGMYHHFFLMRGKQKVAAEVSLSVLTYNMKRVINIMGIASLMTVLRTLRVILSSFRFALTQRKRVVLELYFCLSCASS
jgi:hypothetical protein